MIEPLPYSQILPKCGHHDLFDFQKDVDDLLYSTEMETIVNGMRDVNVFHLFGNNYDNQLNLLLDKGLIFLPIRRSKTYLGFSHRHFDTNTLDKDSMVFGVIARDLDTAKKFKDFDEKNDHVAMGKMLGYPECCSRSFDALIKKSLDPIYEIALNTNYTKQDDTILVSIEDTFPETYIHMRYFSFRVIPWLPCSYECDQSLDSSKDWLKVMRSLDNKHLVDNLLSILKTPSTWSLYSSQVIVNQPPHEESSFFGYATSCYQPGKLNVCFR